jgi:hypothetical protein
MREGKIAASVKRSVKHGPGTLSGLSKRWPLPGGSGRRGRGARHRAESEEAIPLCSAHLGAVTVTAARADRTREREGRTVSETEITYAMIREVRNETGASHDDCRRVLEAAGGDVAKASALWYSEKRPRRRGAADDNGSTSNT